MLTCKPGSHDSTGEIIVGRVQEEEPGLVGSETGRSDEKRPLGTENRHQIGREDARQHVGSVADCLSLKKIIE